MDVKQNSPVDPAELVKQLRHMADHTGLDAVAELMRQAASVIESLQQAMYPSDDAAVDAFAAAMKAKLAEARAKGRGGWQTCAPEQLSIMLREHVEKGDPRDVANFCMFLWFLGKPIVRQPAQQPLTEEMVLRAAKELCRIYAGECQVDEQDTWNIYADQFKRDAKAALAAAHDIGEQP